MIKGLHLARNLDDLVGKVIVLYDGRFGAVSGFIYDSSICLVTDKGEDNYCSLSDVVEIYESLDSEFNNLLCMNYIHRELDKPISYSNEVIVEGIKLHTRYKEVVKESERLKKSPAVWRSKPMYGISVKENDSSFNETVSEHVWLTISDEIKQKYTVRSDRDKVLNQAYKMLREEPSSSEIINKIINDIPEEMDFLSGSSPVNLIAYIKTNSEKEVEKEISSDIRKSLKSSKSFNKEENR